MPIPQLTPAISVKHLQVFLRVHRRWQYLEDVFKQIKELGRGRIVTVTVQTDRTSIDVFRELARIETRLPTHVLTEIHEGPQILNERQNWLLSIKTLYDFADSDADAGIVWDDDWLFSKLGLREMRAHLELLEFDRIEAKWLHCWDNHQQHNALFPEHWAACLFRMYPRDQWKRLMAHCPDFVSRSPRVHRADFDIYHLGYMDPEDRRKAWEAYRAAGKIDGHSLCLVKEPDLKEIEWQ
ncbi:MAG: hypothetical protein V3S83_12330 [Gemmatimonadota bacterium]